MQTDTIVAITSTFVALLALGITIWEGRETENIIAFQYGPSLRFDILYSAKEPSKIVLCNVGLGPMIVKKIQIIIQNHIIDANKEGWVKEVICDLAQNDLKNGHHGTFSLNPTTFEFNDIIQAGEQLSLLEMTDDKSENRYFSKALTRIGLRVRVSILIRRKICCRKQRNSRKR